MTQPQPVEIDAVAKLQQQVERETERQNELRRDGKPVYPGEVQLLVGLKQQLAQLIADIERSDAVKAATMPTSGGAA